MGLRLEIFFNATFITTQTYNTITSLLRKLFTTILTYIDVTLTSQSGYLHHLQISIYMITTCYRGKAKSYLKHLICILFPFTFVTGLLVI